MADLQTATDTALETDFKRELGLFDSTMVVSGLDDRLGHLHRLGRHGPAARQPRMAAGGVARLRGPSRITAALSYGELAAMMPKAGGQYVYLRTAYNPLCGFLYGWTLFTGHPDRHDRRRRRRVCALRSACCSRGSRESRYLIPPVHLSTGYAALAVDRPTGRNSP